MHCGSVDSVERVAGLQFDDEPAFHEKVQPRLSTAFPL